MKRTSVRSGTRRITHGSDVSNVAAMIGSTAFFAPLIVTSPCRGIPPLINKLSIKKFARRFERADLFTPLPARQ